MFSADGFLLRFVFALRKWKSLEIIFYAVVSRVDVGTKMPRRDITRRRCYPELTLKQLSVRTCQSVCKKQRERIESERSSSLKRLLFAGFTFHCKGASFWLSAAFNQS